MITFLECLDIRPRDIEYWEKQCDFLMDKYNLSNSEKEDIYTEAKDYIKYLMNESCFKKNPTMVIMRELASAICSALQSKTNDNIDYDVSSTSFPHWYINEEDWRV